MRLDLLLREGDPAEVREATGVVELEFAFPQPAANRHPEAFLRPVDDLLREQGTEGLLEDPLGLAAAKLELPGNAAGEVGHFDVEERRASFERAHHRSAIDLREDAVLR